MNIESAYRKAGIELRNMLLGIDIDRIDNNMAEKIRNQTRRIVAKLHISAEKWVNDDLSKSYDLASKRTKTQLEILGMKPKKPSMIDQKTVLKEKAFDYFYLANKSIMDTTNRYLSTLQLARNQLNRIQMFDFEVIDIAVEDLAAEAVREQWSRGQLQAKIREIMRELFGELKFIEVKGRTYQIHRYAKLVARTELRKAQTEAALAMAKEYDNDLVEVIGTPGCEGTTVNCDDYIGHIFSISGSNPEYEPLTDTPPYHPNCRCSIHPTTEVALKYREEYR